MKLYASILLLLSLLPGNFNRISAINSYKQSGEEAYLSGRYEDAIDAFKTLVDSLGVEDESVVLNLANAYFHTQDTTNAAYYYSRVAENATAPGRSAAYNQLGIIDQQQNNLDPALAHFKKALKADPSNNNARYNYELLKKLMQQQEQQDQQQQEQQDQQEQEQQDQQEQQEQQQDQQEQDQQQEQQEQQEQQQNEQEQQEQEQQQDAEDAQEKDSGQPQQEDASQEEGEEMDQHPPKSRQEKLEELNLTEEKAQMILEAMRNNEMQYLQQMQRKPKKRPDSGKPDW